MLLCKLVSGDYNPSGKLPVTFYKDTTQLPDFEDYSMNGRTYRFMKAEPLFPFGHGLSYTNFKIGEAQLDKSEIDTSSSVNITISISNEGKTEGVEIIQVYVHKQGLEEGPIKTLKGFKRVNLKPNEMKNVTINLPSNSFEFYDKKARSMKVMPGNYEIFYGNSSDDKQLKKTELKIH